MRLGGQQLRRFERLARSVSAPLDALLAPRALHEDAPHGFGRGGEEVAAAIPVFTTLANQAEICLMDESRGLERLPRRFVGQPVPRQPPQFLVDEWQELRRSFGI